MKGKRKAAAGLGMIVMGFLCVFGGGLKADAAGTVYKSAHASEPDAGTTVYINAAANAGTEPDAVYKDVEQSAEREMLMESFSRLPERERRIVELRFGLGGKEEMTQKEIAEMMGISQSYISRLEKKIVSSLKKEIAKLG